MREVVVVVVIVFLVVVAVLFVVVLVALFRAIVVEGVFVFNLVIVVPPDYDFSILFFFGGNEVAIAFTPDLFKVR